MGETLIAPIITGNEKNIEISMGMVKPIITDDSGTTKASVLSPYGSARPVNIR